MKTLLLALVVCYLTSIANGWSFEERKAAENRRAQKLRPAQKPVNLQPTMKHRRSNMIALGQDGVTMTLKLQDFINPHLSVMIDSKKFICLYEEADLDKNCIVYFSLIFTDLSGKIYMKSDAMQWVGENHQLDKTDGSFDFDNSTYWFGNELQITFDNKPQEMVFIVYDIGNLVSDTDKKLRQGVAVMDYFIQNLTAMTPDTQYSGPFTGVMQGDNKISLTYSISCNQQVYGAMCDMRNCKPVKDEQDEMYCHSQLTGAPFICYAGSSSQQGVRLADSKNCSACPPKFSVDDCSTYVKEGESNEMYLAAEKRAKNFRTATIVLGVFLGLVLLLLIAVIIFFVVFSGGRKKKGPSRVLSEPRSTAYMDARNDALRRENEYKQNTANPDGYSAAPAKEWYRPDHRPAALNDSQRSNGSNGYRRPSPRASPNQSANGSVTGSINEGYRPIREPLLNPSGSSNGGRSSSNSGRRREVEV